MNELPNQSSILNRATFDKICAQVTAIEVDQKDGKEFSNNDITTLIESMVEAHKVLVEERQSIINAIQEKKVNELKRAIIPFTFSFLCGIVDVKLTRELLTCSISKNSLAFFALYYASRYMMLDAGIKAGIIGVDLDIEDLEVLLKLYEGQLCTPFNKLVDRVIELDRSDRKMITAPLSKIDTSERPSLWNFFRLNNSPGSEVVMDTIPGYDSSTTLR